MAYAVINTMGMAATNIDRSDLVGIYSTADVENGTFVTLDKMNLGTNGVVNGYEFTVNLATADDKDIYVVATPEVEYGEDAFHNDPTRFINRKGRPMAIKRVEIGDFFEISKDGFVTNGYPTSAKVGYFAPIGANGKIDTPISAIGEATGAFFKVEGLTKMTLGNETLDGCILRRVQ